MNGNDANINDVITWLMSLGPEYLTIGLVLLVGYVFRLVKSVPNDAIPLLCVFTGAITYGLLAPPAMADPRFHNPTTRLYIVGAFLGFVAWVAHNKFLKQFEDRFQWLSVLLSRGDNATAPSQSTATTNPVKTSLLIGTLILALGFAPRAQAQIEDTNGNHSVWWGIEQVAKSIGSAAPTNLAIIPYGVYSQNANVAKNERWGGGLFAIWNVDSGSHIGVGGGIEMIGSHWVMPNANVTLKTRITPLAFLGITNFSATPYLMAGVTTPLGGTQAEPVGSLVGAGAEVDIANLGKGWKLGVLGGVNKWSGAGDLSGNHIYGGLAFKRML